MISTLIVSVILMVAGIFLVLQLYDFFEGEFAKMLVVVGYAIFDIALLIHWFAEYIVQQLS